MSFSKPPTSGTLKRFLWYVESDITIPAGAFVVHSEVVEDGNGIEAIDVWFVSPAAQYNSTKILDLSNVETKPVVDIPKVSVTDEEIRDVVSNADLDDFYETTFIEDEEYEDEYDGMEF